MYPSGDSVVLLLSKLESLVVDLREDITYKEQLIIETRRNLLRLTLFVAFGVIRWVSIIHRD